MENYQLAIKFALSPVSDLLYWERKDDYCRIREPGVIYIETHQGSGPEADGRPIANSQRGKCACYGTNLKVLSKFLLNDLNVGIKRPEIKAFEGWRLSVRASKLLIELKVQSSSAVLISLPRALNCLPSCPKLWNDIPRQKKETVPKQ